MDKLPKLSPEETARLIDDLISGRDIPLEPDALAIQHAADELLDDATRQAFSGMTHIIRKAHPEVPLPLVSMKAHALAYAAGRIFVANEAIKSYNLHFGLVPEMVSEADKLIFAAIQRSYANWRGLMRELIATDLADFCPPALRAEHGLEPE